MGGRLTTETEGLMWYLLNRRLTRERVLSSAMLKSQISIFAPWDDWSVLAPVRAHEVFVTYATQTGVLITKSTVPLKEVMGAWCARPGRGGVRNPEVVMLPSFAWEVPLACTGSRTPADPQRLMDVVSTQEKLKDVHELQIAASYAMEAKILHMMQPDIRAATVSGLNDVIDWSSSSDEEDQVISFDLSAGRKARPLRLPQLTRMMLVRTDKSSSSSFPSGKVTTR